MKSHFLSSTGGGEAMSKIGSDVKGKTLHKGDFTHTEPHWDYWEKAGSHAEDTCWSNPYFPPSATEAWTTFSGGHARPRPHQDVVGPRDTQWHCLPPHVPVRAGSESQDLVSSFCPTYWRRARVSSRDSYSRPQPPGLLSYLARFYTMHL